MKGMHNEGAGGRQRLYLHRGGLQGSARPWPKRALGVEKQGGGRGFMVPKLQTPAKWPKAEAVVFISFFFSLTSLSLSPQHLPNNHTQSSAKFSAGCSRRLSVIRRLGHLIPCDPNLGTLTRKPKPRADKQALGHDLPDRGQARGEGRGNQQPRAAGLAASLPESDFGFPHTERSRRGFRGNSPRDEPTGLRST